MMICYYIAINNLVNKILSKKVLPINCLEKYNITNHKHNIFGEEDLYIILTRINYYLIKTLFCYIKIFESF